MNHYTKAVLLGLLTVGTAALAEDVAEDVNVKGTMLPVAVKESYEMCEAKGRLDKLSPKFKAV